MKTVFVALLRIPYEGEKFIGVYSSRNNAEKALLKAWKEDASLSRRKAGLVVLETDTDIDTNDTNTQSWAKVTPPPQKQWKEW
jgi:hypothetical protein